MVRLSVVLFVGLCPAAVARELPESRASTGCGGSSPVKTGTTTTMTGVFDGVERSWRVYVPSDYSTSTPVPLVVSTHGWGGSGSQDQSGSGLTAIGGGFIAVFPDGYADNSVKGSWGSWNCVGSTQSPGPQGQTCTASADPSNSYCYSSCNGCNGAGGCDWTTCLNDITPTGIGTNDVNGFIPQLYDYLEETFCIDLTREYHSGMSNGAMFTYQAGVSMCNRLAAIAPVAGSFHIGFDQSPTCKVPVLDLHGTKDTTVPANTTTSADGWKYTITKDIMSKWVKSNGCSSANAGPYTGKLGISSSTASQYDLGCVDWGCDTVSCSWNGGHQYFGGYFGGAKSNGQLIWGFLSQYSNAQHIGKGLLEGETLPANYQLRLTNISAQEPIIDDAKRSLGIDVSSSTEFTFHGRRSHYGNPIHGCRYDEEVITLSNGQNAGTVCAPKRKVRDYMEISESQDSWSRSCTLGTVYANPQNGCPTDMPFPTNGSVSAFPQCLLDTTNEFDVDRKRKDTAHCYLTCQPCNTGLDQCDDSAHSMCPVGADCVAGLLRNIQQGICVYGANSQQQKYNLNDAETNNHCYEMVYHDEGFAAQGYRAGACGADFTSTDDIIEEIICEGDSTKNLKDCPNSQIEVFQIKRGKNPV